MKTTSHLKPKDYLAKEVCRIVNPKQQLLYIKYGVYPIDIYTSKDFENNRDIIVMIFLREESAWVYQKWLNYELE